MRNRPLVLRLSTAKAFNGAQVWFWHVEKKYARR